MTGPERLAVVALEVQARALPALSPPEARVEIESADLPVRVGSRIVISARGPLGRRIRWVAKITAHRPPRAAAARQSCGVLPTGSDAMPNTDL